MMRLVLIGDPVKHSLSPAMHNAALAHLGLDRKFIFETRRVAAGELGEFMASARNGDIAGLAVTMPHKTAVIQYLDGLTDDVKQAGAANTAVVKKGRLEGHNTDGTGCLRALEAAGVKIRGSDVVLVGAGGAARAAAFVLASERANSLIILNRTPKKASELAHLVNNCFDTDVSGHYLDFLGNTKPDILINATPGKLFLPEGFLRMEMAVLDMAYGLGETDLILRAREAGAKAIPGTEMLLHQGAAQFGIFTGKEAPLEIMRLAVGGKT